jgi:ABC-type transport system involved in multi-copper enzyme maturation permease subunit
MSFEDFSVIRALAFCLPFVTHLALLGGMFRDDFDTANIYLFTRGKSKRRWLVGKAAAAAALSLLYYLVLFVTTLCCSAVFGYTFEPAAILLTIFELLFTLALTNTLIVLFAGLLSIKNSPPVVYTLLILIYSSWIVLLPLVHDCSALLQFVPMTHSMMLAHELPSAFHELQGQVGPKLGIPIPQTVIGMFIGGFALLGISTMWIKKADLMKGNER